MCITGLRIFSVRGNETKDYVGLATAKTSAEVLLRPVYGDAVGTRATFIQGVPRPADLTGRP